MKKATITDLDRHKIKRALNQKIVLLALTKYFYDKGYSSLDRPIDPIIIQDLPIMVTGLDTKVEVIPHIVEVDPTISRAVVGWNMFVLGNQRIFLGETIHNSIAELAKQVYSNSTVMSANDHQRCTTARRIISFIGRVLGASEAGYVDLVKRQRASYMPKVGLISAMANNQTGRAYQKSTIG